MSSAANTTAAKWHAENGIYLFWGPGIQASRGHTGSGSVDQVCATLLALAGLPPARDVGGPALPVRRLRTAAALTIARSIRLSRRRRASRRHGTRRVDEDTVAKLRALGYIGATEGKGARSAPARPVRSTTKGLLLQEQGKTERSDRRLRHRYLGRSQPGVLALEPERSLCGRATSRSTSPTRSSSARLPTASLRAQNSSSAARLGISATVKSTGASRC